uniref:Uncharacterized protein n=1 Tax=Oryza punctata TaxID=4537 RepID=A0A0E0JNQ9_ORYPU
MASNPVTPRKGVYTLVLLAIWEIWKEWNEIESGALARTWLIRGRDRAVWRTAAAAQAISRPMSYAS